MTKRFHLSIFMGSKLRHGFIILNLPRLQPEVCSHFINTCRLLGDALAGFRCRFCLFVTHLRMVASLALVDHRVVDTLQLNLSSLEFTQNQQNEDICTSFRGI